MDFPLTRKIVILGDGGCGKSTLVKRLMDEEFDPRYQATLGVDVNVVRYPAGNVIFNMWDCAGQERFGGLREGYYVQSRGAIFTFDLSSRHSYNMMQFYMENFVRVAGDQPCIILGLKSDLNHEVTRAEVLAAYPGIAYGEVSSMYNQNMGEVLEMLAKLLAE